MLRSFLCRKSYVVIVSIITISLLFGCGILGSPEGTTKKFLSLLKEGKHLEAQDMLSTSYRQLAVGMFGGIKNENMKYYYRSGNLTEFEISNIESTGKSSRATVILTTPDGRRFTDHIDLVKEDGKWKIDTF